MIKMKILPGLVFLFQNLIINLPVKYINVFQGMFNDFIWNNKIPRVKVTVLQQEIVNGRIAYPSILKYYQASRLATMLWQWKQEEKEVWAIEQHGVPVPLKEWALMAPALRSKTIRSSNPVYNAIIKNCAKCHDLFTPGQSPLASFLHHPNFSIAGRESDFRRLVWIR